MLPLLLAAAIAAPNVILISVDTLRADHLGFYGHAHPTSPNLDQLAERSLVFDDMICEIPLTGPSFAAMMTSQFPRMTGVTRNGLKLPEDIPTVAEIFSAAGYETICVTSNWTLKTKLIALNRGFEVYDDAFHERRWGVLKSERGAEEVTALALENLLRRDPARPLFAWFHYSEPHAPYEMQKEFKVSSKSDWPDDKGARIKVKYDSEIAFTDHWIAKLLEALPREDTYIVFVGDHGESLEEHGYVGHGRRIYQPGLRIPFMVAGPGIEAGRTRAPMRGVDIGVTMLALAGLEPAPGMVGIDATSGDLPAQRARVIETYGGAVPNLPGAKAVMGDRGPRIQGILLDGWKLILNGKRTELFNLTDDPFEIVDLARQHPERVERLRGAILAWSDRVARRGPDEAELSDEDIEALESLGYID